MIDFENDKIVSMSIVYSDSGINQIKITSGSFFVSFGELSDPNDYTEKIAFTEERPLIGLFGSMNEKKLVSLGIIFFKVECDDSGMEQSSDAVVDETEA